MAKGFLIGAPRSGEGKTLITLGLLRLFKRKGYKIQPFKVGPDYIDPKWHFVACGVPSYNLDLFSMGEGRLKALFHKKAINSQIVIVEGVMGLFDGFYSSFKVAKTLSLPLVLVVDTFGISESIKYLIQGFSEKIKRDGLKLILFLNRVSSERHLLRLERALKGFTILGFLYRDKELELPSRHLGLFLPEDLAKADEVLDRLASNLEKTIDFTLLESLKIDLSINEPDPSFLPPLPYKAIAIAYDMAFNFYYQHLLEELSKIAKIYFFSPLKDEEIPSAAQAVYIGGGYPELWAELLSHNKGTQNSIREWVNEGLPLYAECGGLIYLSKILFWENNTYNFTGLFPFEIYKERLNLGYRWVKPRETLPFFATKKPFYAHEFHYTNLLEPLGKKNLGEIKKIYSVFPIERPSKKFSKTKSYPEGFVYKKCLASYLHLLAF